MADNPPSVAPPACGHAPESEGLRPAELIEHLSSRLQRYVAHRALPRLHSIPEVVIDVPERRHVGGDPFGERIRSRQTSAWVRILHVPVPVPPKAADVQLVIENSGWRRTLSCTETGGRSPSSINQRIARTSATTRIFVQEILLEETLDIAERCVVRALFKLRPLCGRQLPAEAV